MIAKKPTEKMHTAGVEKTLVIQKGIYGFYLHDLRFQTQRGTVCRETSDSAIEDALNGLRPTQINVGERF